MIYLASNTDMLRCSFLCCNALAICDIQCCKCLAMTCWCCWTCEKWLAYSCLQVLAESYPEKDTLWNHYECPKFIPFNPVDKYTIAIIRDKQSGEMMRIMKGAPQVNMTRSTIVHLVERNVV